MTTIKEYKAMIDGATEGPWCVPLYNEIISEKDNKRVAICSGVRADYIIRNNAQFIAASRNIAPELIRVMELMGESIEYSIKALTLRDDNKIDALDKEAIKELKQALSEYRKLRWD